MLKEHEAQRQILEQRLETLNRPEVTLDAEMERRLTERVDQWREILGRQVPVARQIVTKLLADRITFAPEDRDGRRGFRFRATGAMEKLIEGVVPGGFRTVVPPRGTARSKTQALPWVFPLEGWVAAYADLKLGAKSPLGLDRRDRLEILTPAKVGRRDRL